MIWPFKRHTWKYVGKVKAETFYTDIDLRMLGVFVLSERDDGKREAVLVGDPGSSLHAILVRSEVESWKLGGSVPRNLIVDDQLHPSVYEGIPKPTRDFTVIEGGKGE